MKLVNRRNVSAWVCGCAAWAGTASLTHANDINVLLNLSSATGTIPAGGVVLSGSTLYGTGSQGGAISAGTFFSLPVTGGAQTVTSLSGAASHPTGDPLLLGSTLYITGAGMTGGAEVFSAPTAGGSITRITDD